MCLWLSASCPIPKKNGFPEENILGADAPMPPVAIPAATLKCAPRRLSIPFSKPIIAPPCPARDTAGQRVLKDITRACVFHHSGVNLIGSCLFPMKIHRRVPRSECPECTPVGTIASAVRPLRDVEGLAAPIRSAGMRARTLFKGIFIILGVSPGGSCSFLQSKNGSRIM